MSLKVIQPGLLSLLQDKGRFGMAGMGLGTGGPMDPVAATLANKLLKNEGNAVLVEVSFGGLKVQATSDTQIAVTGASLDTSIDGQEVPMWQTLPLREGQTLSLGFSSVGCRSYLSIRGGFDISPSFGSAATVVREGIGGLSGSKLQDGDLLPAGKQPPIEALWVPPRQRPNYHRRCTVRVVQGYQHARFPRVEQRRFYGSEYAVSDRCDRMGYRLEGPQISCEVEGMLSEGIAPGAIQIPADGQPIVLLNDRQTIGGYPKLGSALSIDAAVLAQLRPGDSVNFAPITAQTAHNAIHLARIFEAGRRLEAAPKR